MSDLTKFNKFFLTPNKLNAFLRVIGLCGLFSVIAISFGIYSYTRNEIPNIASLFLIVLGSVVLFLAFVIHFAALFKRNKLLKKVNKENRTNLWQKEMGNFKAIESFEFFEQGPISSDILPSFYPTALYNFEPLPRQFKVTYKDSSEFVFGHIYAIKRSSNKTEKVACLIAITPAINSENHFFLTDANYSLNKNVAQFEALTENKKQENISLFVEKDSNFSFQNLDTEVLNKVLFNPLNVYAEFNVYNDTVHTYLFMSVPTTFMDTKLKVNEAFDDLVTNIKLQASYDFKTLNSMQKVVDLLHNKLIKKPESKSSSQKSVETEIEKEVKDKLAKN